MSCGTHRDVDFNVRVNYLSACAFGHICHGMASLGRSWSGRDRQGLSGHVLAGQKERSGRPGLFYFTS